jgi:CRP-like cAMP-binding protein
MSIPTENQSPLHNSILDALSVEDCKLVFLHLERVELRLGEILSQPEEAIEYVYFPQSGTISVVTLMEDGSQVEVGVIGNEGMFGLPVVLWTDSAPLQAMVQISGHALRLKASVLREELKDCGDFQKALLRYAQACFIQTAMNAACNRIHHLDGRLARWLLMCQDRANADNLPLTHEFISTMLGVRRAGISVAAQKLQAEGFIDYTRGNIRIRDRKGLESYSCECYGIVKREFDRLIAM